MFFHRDQLYASYTNYIHGLQQWIGQKDKETRRETQHIFQSLWNSFEVQRKQNKNLQTTFVHQTIFFDDVDSIV